jgi:hypothetical protein
MCAVKYCASGTLCLKLRILHLLKLAVFLSLEYISAEAILGVQMYGRTTVQGSPFKVRCQPPKADTENSTLTMMQEYAFIDDTVKACLRTVDQFGEKCSADGILVASVLDAASEQVLFDAHIVETGHVRLLTLPVTSTLAGTAESFL